MASVSPGGSGERAHRCLSQGLRLSPRALDAPTDAHLFAQTRTLRIIQLNGLAGSTGLIDLAARADAILPMPRAIFMSFRELASARGHALLQFFDPIEYDMDLRHARCS